MTPVAEYNIDGSNALSIDRNGILYAMDNFDVYCYDPVSYTHLDVYKRQGQQRASKSLLSG